MNENFKDQEPSGQSQDFEETVLELLKKMQQQLVYLERKVDAMGGGGGASSRPFNKGGGRFSSRPPRSFDRPFHSRGGERHDRGGNRHDRGPERHERAPRQDHFAKPFYQDRPREEKRQGFSKNRKPFFKRQRDPD